jgi:hypothetical protein
MVKFDPRAAALAAMFVLVAGAARAADADEAVATRSDPAQAPSTAADASAPAPAPVAPMTTDQQIKAWLSQSAPVSRMSRDDVEPWTDAPTVAQDGRPHGEVGGMIGTGGARAAWGTVTMPLGKNGTATFSYAQGHKLPYYGYAPYYGGGSYYGYGAYYDPRHDPRYAPYAPW